MKLNSIYSYAYTYMFYYKLTNIESFYDSALSYYNYYKKMGGTKVLHCLESRFL